MKNRQQPLALSSQALGIVVPGQVISAEPGYIRGHGTFTQVRAAQRQRITTAWCGSSDYLLVAGLHRRLKSQAMNLS